MSGARFVRFYPSDWRSGCIGLTPEEEGVYMRVCAHFWETGVKLALDDADAASRLMLDVRMWRRIKAKLISKGKLHVAEDGVFNPRAERELTAANRAAKKEGSQTDMGAARGSSDGEPEDGRNQVEGWDAGAHPLEATKCEVAAKSERSLGEVGENFANKGNENNSPQKEPIASIRSHKEVNQVVRSEYDAANGPGAVELNDATREIVSGIAKFLNNLAPDYPTAKRIIASNIALYGEKAVRDGYAELRADVEDNKVRIPSAKVLLGYFKTASERPKGETKPRQAMDFSSQRIEGAKAFMAILNEERAA